MVRLALQRLRPEVALHFPYSFPVLLLCGDNDSLVSEKWGRQFVQEQLDQVLCAQHHRNIHDTDGKNADKTDNHSNVRWIEYRTVSGANHNSILSDANLTLVLESLR